MATLLLRLSAPLQSWGVDSKYNTRRTAREPSKSGVIGLLAAALGRTRADDLSDLSRLRFGVRVDKEGMLLRDYHTVYKPKEGKTELTDRYYLSDAVFLVGLESEDMDFLIMLEQALHSPAYPLFLGRRSCPPDLPFCLGIRPEGLLESLKLEPWLLPEWEQRKKTQANVRLVFDDEDGYMIQKDHPLSFSPVYRYYGFRRTQEIFCKVESNTKEKET